jgi:aspartyl-tRNA(Asn)/glutamyl-tRNA(Gln) amidotransferase subunit A
VRGASVPRGGRFRVGVPTKHFFDQAEAEVTRNFWRALDHMEASGEFSRVDLETDSGFERFTRARACVQLSEAAWFYEELVSSKAIASKMNRDVVTLLRRGMRLGMVRYLDAELVRLESIRVFGRMLKEADVIAMPTTRMVAPKLDDVLGNEAGDLRRLLLQNTEVFNLCGFPALSIPSNPGASELPTGIQLAGGLGEDARLLSVGQRAMRAIARSS